MNVFGGMHGTIRMRKCRYYIFFFLLLLPLLLHPPLQASSFKKCALYQYRSRDGKYKSAVVIKISQNLVEETSKVLLIFQVPIIALNIVGWGSKK